MTRMKSVLVVCGLVGFASIAGGCEDDPPKERRDVTGDDAADDAADDDAADDDDDVGARTDAASRPSERDAEATARDSATSGAVDAASARDAAMLPDAAVSEGGRAAPMVLTSSVVQDGMRLAMEHRCAGQGNANVSPPLTWTPGPEGTLSYALIMRDVTRGVVLHWTLYDLPATTTSLPAGVPSGYEPAELGGAKQGPSYLSALGYQGPCATGSGVNTYEFTIYALEVASVPGLTERSTAAQIVSAVEMHDLASAKLTVTSSRGT